MNNKLINRVFASVSACVLGLCSAGITASALGKTETADTSAVYEAAKIIRHRNGEFIFINAPSPDAEKTHSNLMEKRLNTAPSGDDFLERCKGQQWGAQNFGDFTTLNRLGGADAAKTIYDNLYDACTKIWNSSEDITPAQVKIQTGETTYTYYSAILETEPLAVFKRYNWSAVTDEEFNDLIDDIDHIYYSFRHDNPQFYFLGTAVIGWNNGKLSVVLSDESYLKGATRTSLQNAVKSYVESTASLVKNDFTCSDYDNAFALYKDVMNRMEYARDDKGVVSTKASAYNIIGGIVGENNKDEGASGRKGVCESYTRIFSLILNYNNIDNIVVTGNGKGDHGWEGHAWNLIKLDDGKYYFADATWDDRGTGTINNNSNRFFAKGTADFKSDHVLDTYNDPTRDYLYKVPEIPEKSFNKSADLRAMNPRLVDFNKDNVSDTLDIRQLQEWAVKGGFDSSIMKFIDMNGDNKLNNRDLKKLQKILNKA